MFFKIYCKWYTMCLDIRYFFKFLYKHTFKRIFAKEIIAIYVHSTGNDNNSGFNSEKPKLTLASAIDLIADCPLTKSKHVRVMLVSDSKGRESITVPNKKKRIKL